VKPEEQFEVEIETPLTSVSRVGKSFNSLASGIIHKRISSVHHELKVENVKKKDEQ